MDERPARNTDVGDTAASQHQVLFETAQALAESTTIEQAAPRMLKAVCEAIGWECGALWQVNRARNTLHCVGTWSMPDLALAEFMAVTVSSTFVIGIGLPGRVWASGQPAWLLDVVKDTNFPRAPLAAKVGLHGALALPIGVGHEVVGVMEFFSR